MVDHKSGLQIRMRGYTADGEIGRGYFVIVEAVEGRDRLKQRLKYRYGLSPQQVDILMMSANRSPREIAAHLRVKPATLHKSMGQLADKLDLDGRVALRSFAASIMKNGEVPGSLPMPS